MDGPTFEHIRAALADAGSSSPRIGRLVRELTLSDQARFVARMLEQDDPALVRLGLPGGGTGVVEQLREVHPDLLPLDLVRTRTADPDRGIRHAALQLLCALHAPEDALRVLAHADHEWARSVERATISWLGALPATGALAASLDAVRLGDLLARRRCAGLTGTLDTTARSVGRTTAQLVFELRDEAMFRAWIGSHGLGNRSPSRSALEVTVSYGDAGIAAIRERLDDRAPGEFVHHAVHRFWEALRSRVAEGSAPPYEREFPASALEHANSSFASGHLDTPHWRLGATAEYARILFYMPHHAHAALQLAWIDRGFGTPITSDRIAWLRELGVRDASLLDELARPVAPWPYDDGCRGRRDPEPGARARTFEERRREVTAHLARVRSATA